jgi:NTP pyrophosphatase (non-canonical NTP hydrolase)
VLSIREWQELAHDLATKKGWWDGHERNAAGVVQLSPDQILSKLALIHSEVSEATEAVRSGDMTLRFRDGDDKPEGFAVELADALIRIFDLAGAMGLDLEGAAYSKNRFNAGREYRHGKVV